MKNDYFEAAREQIAVSLIARWKANESKLMALHGSRSEFFLQEMCKELWKDPKIREEFQNDKEALLAFLENEHRVTDHKKGISRHNKADYSPADDVADDAGIMAKWDADPALQREFDGNFETFKAWKSNKNRVRIYN